MPSVEEVSPEAQGLAWPWRGLQWPARVRSLGKSPAATNCAGLTGPQECGVRVAGQHHEFRRASHADCCAWASAMPRLATAMSPRGQLASETARSPI